MTGHVNNHRGSWIVTAAGLSNPRAMRKTRLLVAMPGSISSRLGSGARQEVRARAPRPISTNQDSPRIGIARPQMPDRTESRVLGEPELWSIWASLESQDS